MKIEVIDKDGWRKTFSCEKTLFHIGSAAMNDLILDARRGAGVSTRHAQLIALPDGTGYRLVNLGDTNILLVESAGDNPPGDKPTPVPPHNVGTIGNGSVLKMGEFTLHFQGEAVIRSSAGSSPVAAPTSARSSHIGLRLSLPYTTLAPHQTLVGKLLIGNHGDRAGVQFDLELEGIESECYRIEPAPLLSSGAESEVGIRFYQRGGKPLAGEHMVTIRAIAPQAYPGEEATVTCTLKVEPFFKHTLRPVPVSAPVAPQDLLPPVIPSQPVSAATRPITPMSPPKPVPAPPVEVKPAPRTPTPPPEDWWSIPEKATAAAPPPEPEATKPIMVQHDRVASVSHAAPEKIVTTPPVAEPVAAPEVETAREVITPPHHAEAPDAAPEPPPVIEAMATPEPEVATPILEAPLPVAEPEPVIEAAVETPAPSADDWWGIPEPPPTEKPDVLTLKAAPVTLPKPPTEIETEDDTESKTRSADDDWWSET
jgi:hypothetical protein